MHLLDLATTAKKAVIDRGMLGWQYNTIGVSDAISMGSEGTLLGWHIQNGTALWKWRLIIAQA